MLNLNDIVLKDYGIHHIEKTVMWLNDELIKENFGIQNNVTIENHKKWFLSAENLIIKAIYAEKKYIGNILLHLNLKHDSGFFQIYIGENDIRGRGYAEKAIRKSVSIFFDELKLHRIWLKVFPSNDIAIHLYEKVGFVREGIERDSFFDGENYKNQLVYSLLRTEWND